MEILDNKQIIIPIEIYSKNMHFSTKCHHLTIHWNYYINFNLNF